MTAHRSKVLSRSEAAAGLAGLAVATALVASLVGSIERAYAQTALGPFTQHLVADLSDRFVSITLGFAGTELLLYGATDGAGDVVIIVRGPPVDVTVRRKDRIAGIWMNADHADYRAIPGYYLVASTAPIEEIVPEEIRVELAIGLDTLPLEPASALSDDERRRFREALVRSQRRLGLYDETPGSVSLKSDRLFRTQVVFPSNVPTGDYVVEVMLMREGHVVGMTTTELGVDRRGFEALIFQFAHREPAKYGLIAIIIALVAGWFAGFVFRKI